VSGKVELQTYPEMTARVSEKSDFKTDPVIPTKASENSANPDK
jgi:hypothetical protein